LSEFFRLRKTQKFAYEWPRLVEIMATAVGYPTLCMLLDRPTQPVACDTVLCCPQGQWIWGNISQSLPCRGRDRAPKQFSQLVNCLFIQTHITWLI